MAIGILFSLFIIFLLSFARVRMEKDAEVPVAIVAAILAAPLTLFVQILMVWGIFALAACFVPFAYTSAIVVAVASVETIVNLIVKDIILAIENK